MRRYIGICKDKEDEWYTINIMLYNRMLKLTLYTKRYKLPRSFWYDKKTFNFYFNNDEGSPFNLSWFFGVQIN